MSLWAAVICFYSSLRSEWCIETPLRRQILQTLPLLSTCLSWPFVHTAHSPSCAPPIQHMAWPRASIDLTGSGCQATMVGTSECLGDTVCDLIGVAGLHAGHSPVRPARGLKLLYASPDSVPGHNAPSRGSEGAGGGLAAHAVQDVLCGALNALLQRQRVHLCTFWSRSSRRLTICRSSERQRRRAMQRCVGSQEEFDGALESWEQPANAGCRS